MKRRYVKFIAVLTILFLPSLCFGTDVGVTSTQVMAGYVISPVFEISSRPDLNYVMTNVRVEWMRFEKNFRMLAEATYSKTTTGASGYLIGGTLLLRYDFEPIGKLIPYAQVGAGILYTDLDRDYSQDLVGNEIEFNPQASLGFRYAIHSKLSLDVEGIFHHVSNAGLEDRNIGVNGVGCLVGVTYYWG
ncbi:MAG: acyloxyacyl hydrolase [Thermodesulfobacteriota bacterium]|nr:acyloxyacyl hydrolase [Thermodesulfobacteriota bacterium]